VNLGFEVHYNHPTLPDNNFKQQLCVRKPTFQILLNILAPQLTRQDNAMHDCITPEKVVAISLYRVAHGNSYMSLGPAMNVGKSTVVEAVQDVVNALFDERNQYIRFPRTAAESAASIQTNSKGGFIDTVCGFPGSAYDARVLQNSNLYDEGERGTILQEPCVNIDGTDIRPYLVGDSAYPRAPWLIIYRVRQA